LAALIGPLRIGFALCSILFSRLETRIKFEQRGYPKNYIAVVHKTPSEELAIA
jgi:hypothetical protein